MAFSIKKVFRIPGYFLGIYFKIGLKKREGTRVIGITNKVGSSYVLFLDYDIDDIMMIIDEVRTLQKKHRLSTAYFFKTGGGFHVIIPDLLNYQKLITILTEATIEYAYLDVPRNNKKKVWVLRLTDKKDNKIIYYGQLWHDSTRKTSNPHLRLLMKKKIPVAASQVINSSYDYEELQYATYEA